MLFCNAVIFIPDNICRNSLTVEALRNASIARIFIA